MFAVRREHSQRFAINFLSNVERPKTNAFPPMLPLRAVHPPKRRPLVTRLILLLNVAVFAAQVFSLQGAAFIARFGVRPKCYFAPESCRVSVENAARVLAEPLFVSQFLHADVLHLAFNLLFLWVFGPELEERLGRTRFVFFYLMCGVVAALCQMLSAPFSAASMIGASGAISGVLGAYFVLHRRSWILTFVPPIFLFPAPAPLFLALWFLLQIASVFVNVPLLRSDANVAIWAHVGGFLFGAAWAWRIKPWWKKSATKK